MIISIDAEKAVKKNSTPICDENSPESRHRRNMSQHNKSHIQQIHSKHYPQWGKFKAFPLKREQNNSANSHHYYLTQFWKSLSQAITEQSEIKGMQIGKEVKHSLFSDDMILYRENHKDTTRKLIQLTSEYGKVAYYKINTQKSLEFLYTNNEKIEKLRKLPHVPLQ